MNLSNATSKNALELQTIFYTLPPELHEITGASPKARAKSVNANTFNLLMDFVKEYFFFLLFLKLQPWTI